MVPLNLLIYFLMFDLKKTARFASEPEMSVSAPELTTDLQALLQRCDRAEAQYAELRSYTNLLEQRTYSTQQSLTTMEQSILQELTVLKRAALQPECDITTYRSLIKRPTATKAAQDEELVAFMRAQESKQTALREQVERLGVALSARDRDVAEMDERHALHVRQLTNAHALEIQALTSAKEALEKRLRRIDCRSLVKELHRCRGVVGTLRTDLQIMRQTVTCFNTDVFEPAPPPAPSVLRTQSSASSLHSSGDWVETIADSSTHDSSTAGPLALFEFNELFSRSGSAVLPPNKEATEVPLSLAAQLAKALRQVHSKQSTDEVIRESAVDGLWKIVDLLTTGLNKVLTVDPLVKVPKLPTAFTETVFSQLQWKTETLDTAEGIEALTAWATAFVQHLTMESEANLQRVKRELRQQTVSTAARKAFQQKRLLSADGGPDSLFTSVATQSDLSGVTLHKFDVELALVPVPSAASDHPHLFVSPGRAGKGPRGSASLARSGRSPRPDMSLTSPSAVPHHPNDVATQTGNTSPSHSTRMSLSKVNSTSEIRHRLPSTASKMSSKSGLGERRGTVRGEGGPPSPSTGLGERIGHTPPNENPLDARAEESVRTPVSDTAMPTSDVSLSCGTGRRPPLTEAERLVLDACMGDEADAFARRRALEKCMFRWLVAHETVKRRKMRDFLDTKVVVALGLRVPHRPQSAKGGAPTANVISNRLSSSGAAPSSQPVSAPPRSSSAKSARPMSGSALQARPFPSSILEAHGSCRRDVHVGSLLKVQPKADRVAIECPDMEWLCAERVKIEAMKTSKSFPSDAQQPTVVVSSYKAAAS